MYGIIRHVSASGASRRIDFYVIRDNEPVYLTGYIARLLEYKRKPREDGLTIKGGGMDMIFAVVHELGQVLHNKGSVLKSQQL